MAHFLHPKIQRTLTQYLSNHAEVEANYIASYIPSKTYQRCLVIPVFNESQQCIQRICNSALKTEKLLIIIIVNQPDNRQDSSTNQQFWDTLTTHHISVNKSQHHHWLSINNSAIDLLLINRFTKKIPQSQGVGLARKIGGDIACQLIAKQCLLNLWVHHTDADTHLPDNYFQAVDALLSYIPDNQSEEKKQTTYSAAVYRYTHKPSDDEEIYNATLWYEKALDYYVRGLKYANSPYAYHTLGSCIANNSYHYCQARGFPKKSGGEDFYLLNKLAKLGNIAELKNTTLHINARLSDRVPFGTGPATEKILAMENPEQSYLYYHPLCFSLLSNLLLHFEVLFNYKKKTEGKSKTIDLAHYHPWLTTLNTPLRTALTQLGIETLFKHVDKQIKSKEQCIQHCHHWLDGFKTLKLIHLLEEHYPKQALSLSLQQTTKNWPNH